MSRPFIFSSRSCKIRLNIVTTMLLYRSTQRARSQAIPRCFRDILVLNPLRSGKFHFIRSFGQIPDQDEVMLKFKFPLATHTISQITNELDTFLHSKTNTSLTLQGHLNRKPRIMAKNSFAELRDVNNDTVQLILAPETTPTLCFEILANSIPEESVSVTGKVQLKESRSGQREWELLVTNYQVLNESNLDAARLDKLKHSLPDTLPPQYRYLQLRTAFYQKALRNRSKVSHLIRSVLVDNHDFTELETPLLFKSTPEGAREFLVPTRTSNSFYALPQSPQQYKQILMSSGFTKYFQVAKCFRDEDLRSDRQPEFTQIDLEMSFINHSDQIGIVVEDIILNIWDKILKTPIYTVNSKGYLRPITTNSSGGLAFNKLPYIEALSKYGIDKPDLRSEISFVNLSKFLRPNKNPLFPVLEACVLKQALSNGRIPKVVTDPSNYSRRKPIVIPIKTESDAIKWHQKFVEKDVFRQTELFNELHLKSLLNLEPGDILAISDRADIPYENPTPLGRFRQLAISEYPNWWKRKIQLDDGTIQQPDGNEIFVASWVNDFPLFNPIEIDSHDYPVYDTTKFESTHHPFTMVKPDDYNSLQKNPLNAKGEHYDLVINGTEVGGGSRRVHDPKLQTYIFKDILQIDNYNELFGHLLQALSMGCPPHAGIALGFDRLCAMLVGSSSIRDVIAFPKNQSGVDPVVDSPTSVPETTLREYCIKTV